MSEPDPNALAALIAEVKDTNERLRQASDGLDTAGDPSSSQWMADFRVDEDIIVAAEAALIQSHLPQGEDTARLDWYADWLRTEIGWIGYFHGEQLYGLRQGPLDYQPTEAADCDFSAETFSGLLDAARAPQRDEGNGG